MDFLAYFQWYLVRLFIIQKCPTVGHLSRKSQLGSDALFLPNLLTFPSTLTLKSIKSPLLPVLQSDVYMYLEIFTLDILAAAFWQMVGALRKVSSLGHQFSLRRGAQLKELSTFKRIVSYPLYIFCRMVTGFGGYRNVMSGGVTSSISGFQMR